MAKGLDPGSKIARRYVIERTIAAGPVATVYEALDTQRHQKVALKVVPPPPGEEDPLARVDRFRREAAALARLSHGNIVRVLDCGADESGAPYLVMPLVAGGSLAERLERGRLDVRSAVQVGVRVASALQYAHEEGLVHRNVDADSILLEEHEDGDVVPMLVGFGLAKHSGQASLTVQSVVLGSVATMAPEQVQGREVDGRTDLYALGALLFRLLTGRYPFEEKERIDVLAHHLNSPPPSLASVDPELRVPPALDGILQRCLAKDPDDRYPDADALRRDLEACLDVDPSRYTSAPAPAPARPVEEVVKIPPERLPLPVVIGAVVAVVVVGVVTGWAVARLVF